MIRALWWKTYREGQWLLLSSMAVLAVFLFIRVWITSQVNTSGVRKLLQYAPDFVKEFLVVPLDVLATPAGRIAIGYDDPLVVLVVSIWAIARGSDAVSGEIGRGTMEMLLAQPVRRLHVIATHAAVTVLGVAALACSAWLGTWFGLQWITLEEPVEARIYLPAALNLFALGLFLAGLATLLSAFDRYRSRTIGLVVGFFVVSMVIKLIAVTSVSWRGLRYFSFLTAFEPQKMVYAFWPEVYARQASTSWQLLLNYNLLLIGLGVLSYALAALVFCRRDLPAPL